MSTRQKMFGLAIGLFAILLFTTTSSVSACGGDGEISCFGVCDPWHMLDGVTCMACGGNNQIPCVNPAKDTNGCRSGLYLGMNLKCYYDSNLGGHNQLAFFGTICDPWNMINPEWVDHCMACGGDNQIPCVNPAKDTNGCQSGFYLGMNAKCYSDSNLGGHDQIAYAGEICDPWHMINPEWVDHCMACGGNNQIPCVNPAKDTNGCQSDLSIGMNGKCDTDSNLGGHGQYAYAGEICDPWHMINPASPLHCMACGGFAQIPCVNPWEDTNGCRWEQLVSVDISINNGYCQIKKVPDLTDTKFSVLIASDTQYHWYKFDKSCDNDICLCQETESEDCAKHCSRESNDRQSESMLKASELLWPASSGITASSDTPVADIHSLIINGDLTDFWHLEQKIEFALKVNNLISNLPSDFVIFLGLGNHDIHNNICDGKGYPPFDLNANARDAMSTIKKLYNNVDGINFDPNSLAYSYNVGDFHFVQLHLNPSYSIDVSHYTYSEMECLFKSNKYGDVSPNGSDPIIGSSFGWLKDDLQKTSDEKFIILNMHVAGDEKQIVDHDDPAKYWGLDVASRERNKAELSNIISNHNIVAIFSGHMHCDFGYQKNYELNGQEVRNKRNNSVPWFRSGASESYTYLIAEFGKTSIGISYMNVGTVSSIGGNTEFIGNPKTYILDDDIGFGLEDAVRVLQVLAGMETTTTNRYGDDKIEIEDAIYILQILAGIRM